jgi:hypothetical protein
MVLQTFCPPECLPSCPVFLWLDAVMMIIIIIIIIIIINVPNRSDYQE